MKTTIYARYSDKLRQAGTLSFILRMALMIILALLPSVVQAKFNFYTVETYAASFIGQPIGPLVQKWGPPSEDTVAAGSHFMKWRYQHTNKYGTETAYCELAFIVDKDLIIQRASVNVNPNSGYWHPKHPCKFFVPKSAR
jgi:hypothetical protein